MSTLPLWVNGQLIQLDQLSGFNYVNGYPELCAQLVRNCQDPMYGLCPSNCFIYPLPGKQKIWAFPGRSWQPGTRLRAVKIGNTSNWRTIIVHAYNDLTGEMDIEVVATSTFETPQVGIGGWYLTPYFSEPLHPSSLQPVNLGGTAGGTVDDARIGLQLPNNARYSTFFSDYVFPDSFCRRTTSGVDVGEAYTDYRTSNLPFDFVTRPGLMNHGALLNGAIDIISFGRPTQPWTDMSGTDTYMEWAVNFRTLSTGGLYLYEGGLIGPNAKISVSYRDTLNSGRFQIIYGTGGAYTTTNTAITVVANTWYKMQIQYNGANWSLFINGANAQTTAIAAYANVATTNLMVPMERITMFAGGTADVWHDYMFFRKHFANGR